MSKRLSEADAPLPKRASAQSDLAGYLKTGHLVPLIEARPEVVFAPLDVEEIAFSYLSMRLTRDELIELSGRIRSRLDERGIWVAKTLNTGYPQIAFSSAHARAEVNSHSREKPIARYVCSHIILLAAGKVPTSLGLEASHLCHEPKCCLAEHLIWESPYRNNRRRRCTIDCSCGLNPACFPQAH